MMEQPQEIEGNGVAFTSGNGVLSTVVEVWQTGEVLVLQVLRSSTTCTKYSVTEKEVDKTEEYPPPLHGLSASRIHCETDS
jgi:hypothetical protein